MKECKNERIEDPWFHGEYWARAIYHIGMSNTDEDEIKKSFKDVKSGLKKIIPNENSAFRNKLWVTFWKCLEMGSEEIIPTMTYDEWRASLIQYLQKNPLSHYISQY